MISALAFKGFAYKTHKTCSESASVSKLRHARVCIARVPANPLVFLNGYGEITVFGGFEMKSNEYAVE